jgi:hypothetical protein
LAVDADVAVITKGMTMRLSLGNRNDSHDFTDTEASLAKIKAMPIGQRSRVNADVAGVPLRRGHCLQVVLPKEKSDDEMIQ